MINDEERREVARKLRELASEHSAVQCGSVEHALGLGYEVYGAIAAFSSEAVARVADLIEPGERTCRNVSEGDIEFVCSNCHSYTDLPTNAGIEIGFMRGSGNNLNYCPYCGARVVE